MHNNLLSLPESNSTRALRNIWNAKKDTFFFLVNPMQDKISFTKREVLSIIAKFFNSAGWLSPVKVSPKLIMQQIWLDKWNGWKSFIMDYDDLNLIEIPRCTHFSTIAIIDFYEFSDVSEKAYFAYPYISVPTNEYVWTALLASKGIVSP